MGDPAGEPPDRLHLLRLVEQGLAPAERFLRAAAVAGERSRFSRASPTWRAIPSANATSAAANLRPVRHRRRALERAEQLLRRGRSFFISIEGRRSAGGLQEYKTGPLRMAAANASIVPFVFAGAHERLPLGAWRVRPGSVRVVFLPAVSVPGGDAEAVARAKAELRHMAERARADMAVERGPWSAAEPRGRPAEDP